MADVYLSYARADGAEAARVVAAIERRGWTVFWDPQLRAGDDWVERLGDELDAARAVVVLWSSSSVKSRWVKEEALAARSQDKLVPALLDGVSPPFGFFGVHAVDLSSWLLSSSDGNREIVSLLDGIAAKVGRLGLRVSDSAYAGALSSAIRRELRLHGVPDGVHHTTWQELWDLAPHAMATLRLMVTLDNARVHGVLKQYGKGTDLDTLRRLLMDFGIAVADEPEVDSNG